MAEDLIEAVVVYCLRTTDEGSIEVLLGAKQSGNVAGWLVGPGGRVEAGESLAQAASRELFEEVGIAASVDSFRQVAELNVTFTDGITLVSQSRPPTRVAVLVRNCSGEEDIVSNGEMADINWYDIDTLPLDLLPPTDRRWLSTALRQVLQGRIWVFTYRMTSNFQAADFVSGGTRAIT